MKECLSEENLSKDMAMLALIRFINDNNITMEELENILEKRMTPRERQEQGAKTPRKNTSLLLGQQDINVKDRLQVVKDRLNARPIEMQQKIPSDLERRMTYYDNR